MMDGTPLVLAVMGVLALADRMGSAARVSQESTPLKLFHGTKHEFDHFVLGHEGRKDCGWLGRGIYLTDSDIVASMYAMRKKGPDSPRVLTVSVSVAPEQIYKANLKNKEEIAKAKDSESASIAFSEDLIKKGYVGAVLDHGKNIGREFVIFDPSLIRITEVRELPSRSSVRGSASAPGYRSWSWTQQDWRSVEVGDSGVLRWSRACGARGTRSADGRPALCLPLAVIEELSMSASGRKILREQAERKAVAAIGERVPWHPEIKRLHAELQAVTPRDRPRSSKR